MDGGRLWVNGQRQNFIYEGIRHDINQARAFFEPGIVPGFEHGMGFFGIESAGNYRCLETGKQGIERRIQTWRIDDHSFSDRVGFAKTNLFSTSIEENK